MSLPILRDMREEIDEMNQRAERLTAEDAKRLLRLLNQVLENESRQVDQPLPHDWVPNENVRAWASHMVPEVEYDIEFEKFRNYYLGEGVSRRSWDAAWRNWLLRSRSEYTRTRRSQSRNRDRRREDITRAAVGADRQNPLAE